MDLNLTPEELAFRHEVRDWVRANLPADLSHKVLNSLRLSRDDMQRWARILGGKGWLGYAWPKQFGGPGWNAVQKHLFEEECALAGAPRIVPFGPVMVAPVIMAFGSPEQHKRFLPGIALALLLVARSAGAACAPVSSATGLCSSVQGDTCFVDGKQCPVVNGSTLVAPADETPG